MTDRSTLRRLVVWGPLVGYLALIFYLSSRSFTGMTVKYPDKLVHFLEYGGLTVLMARAFNGTIRKAIPVNTLMLAGVLVMIYALSDEIHQSFVPNRASDWHDVAADLSGMLAACVALSLVGRRLGRRVATGAGPDVASGRPLNDLAPKEPQ